MLNAKPIKTLKNFALSFDNKDWELMNKCLCQEIWIDYSSFRGEEPKLIHKLEFIDLRKIGLQDLTTNHLFKNFKVQSKKKNQACCICDFEIQRFKTDQNDFYHSYGTYHFELIYTIDSWKIKKIKQLINKNEGNRTIHGAFN